MLCAGVVPFDSVEQWKRNLTILLRDKDKQELISKEKKDRRNFEKISALASKVGLYRLLCLLAYSEGLNHSLASSYLKSLGVGIIIQMLLFQDQAVVVALPLRKGFSRHRSSSFLYSTPPHEAVPHLHRHLHSLQRAKAKQERRRRSHLRNSQWRWDFNPSLLMIWSRNERGVTGCIFHWRVESPKLLLMVANAQIPTMAVSNSSKREEKQTSLWDHQNKLFHFIFLHCPSCFHFLSLLLKIL
ncbi:uncharacterized protein LOC133030194 isoform X1 [Cannabis sativa]|uniref:uncharacterized protein LOC133030194 isoform X1 n=1 Tax=Cannabis sativa TaxID=3483 RepID=UPI0029CA8FC1|nr:uncharacterized protein LOC133030194 isoform X1 [Cannabis sativa]